MNDSFIYTPSMIKSINLLSKRLNTFSSAIDNSSFIRLSKQFQNLSGKLQSSMISSGLLESIIKQQKLYENIANKIPKFNQTIIGNIHKIHNSMISSGLLESIEDQPKLYENIVSNISKVSKEFNSLHIDSELVELNDIYIKDIEILNEKVEKGINLTKEDFFSLLSILSFIFALYGYVYPDNSEDIKTRNLIQSLDTKWTQINSKETYYEVAKKVNIRKFSNSSKNSKILNVASIGQRLLVLQSKPYWVQVEYYDEIKKETTIGWVSKKYTKKLK